MVVAKQYQVTPESQAPTQHSQEADDDLHPVFTHNTMHVDIDSASIPMKEAKRADGKLSDAAASDVEQAGEHHSLNAAHSSVKNPTSWCDTLLHLLRGNVGSGVFAMGDAFHHAGIIVAPVLTLLLALACVHSQHILLQCSSRIARKSATGRRPDFADTVKGCFETGPPAFRRKANLAKKLVNLFLCITQLGFCCVYFVFIANNVKKVMDEYITPLDVRVYMALSLLPILLSSWIRSLKYLAPVSGVANLLMAMGLSVTIYYSSQDLPPISERKAFAGWTNLPLFFGTAIYAFEGIGLVLPLQNEMKKPKKFTATVGVLNIGMSMVTALFTTIGFLGYLKYGDNVKGSVTLNLPQGDILAQAVQLAVSIAMMLTYALQFYVPVEILWPSVRARVFPQDADKPEKEAPPRAFAEISFRTALVLVTFTLAELVPQLGLAISLVGAVSSSALALLFPSICELILAFSERGQRRVSWWLIAKDAALIVLGVLGTVTGTYCSLRDIVLAFTHPDAITGGH